METILQGHVAAVSLSPTGGVPKRPQEFVHIGPQGVEGDYHAGPINRHKKTGDPEPNRRQITLVAQEVLEDLSRRLHIDLKAGDLGENLLLLGLGDLSQLQPGDQIVLEHGAVLEVTAQNRPCDTIRVYHPALVEEIAGRRGVTAVVLNPGVVRPGDACRAERALAASGPA